MYPGRDGVELIIRKRKRRHAALGSVADDAAYLVGGATAQLAAVRKGRATIGAHGFFAVARCAKSDELSGRRLLPTGVLSGGWRAEAAQRGAQCRPQQQSRFHSFRFSAGTTGRRVHVGSRRRYRVWPSLQLSSDHVRPQCPSGAACRLGRPEAAGQRRKSLQFIEGREHKLCRQEYQDAICCRQAPGRLRCNAPQPRPRPRENSLSTSTLISSMATLRRRSIPPRISSG